MAEPRRSPDALIEQCSRHDIPPVIETPHQGRRGHALHVGLMTLGQGVLTHRWLGSPPNHGGEALVLLGARRASPASEPIPTPPEDPRNVVPGICIRAQSVYPAG